MDLTIVDLPVLQGWLNQARDSFAAWQSGGKITQASYSQGNGSRGVGYAVTDVNQLKAWIASLEAAIAARTGAMVRPSRRAIGIRFGGRGGGWL